MIDCEETFLRDVWIAAYAAAFTRYRHYEKRGQIYTARTPKSLCSKMAIDEADEAVATLSVQKRFVSASMEEKKTK